MVSNLPLDSPLWNRLSSCFSAENAVAFLREIMATRQLGEAWNYLKDEILHQGSVYEVSFAAIPHLVDVAPYLLAASRRDLWIEIGFVVTADPRRSRFVPGPGLQEGLTAALRTAETRAVLDFLADTDVTPADSTYYALACVAFARHRVGRALWDFLTPSLGYVRVPCPGCGAECEVDGFADPLSPPCPAPPFISAPGGSAAWQDVAAAIERSGRDQVLGPGWDSFFAAARHVALAGVPVQAPPGAVWWLVAAMVATRSAGAAPWARTLARLAGHVRCLACDRVWAIADAMGGRAAPEPVDVISDPQRWADLQGVLFQTGQDEEAAKRRSRGVPVATVADATAGFRPAPGRKLRSPRVSVRTLWHAGRGAVDALTMLPGRTAVVAAGSEGVSLREVASGTLAGRLLPGPAVAVAPLALPDGGVVIAAAGGDGTLRWWDASTGRPLDDAVTAGAAAVLSLAPVLAPPRVLARAASWLAGLSDSPAVLAVGSADGAIRLWDPVTRAPLADLFQRPARRAVAMTGVDLVSYPWTGTDLVVVYGDRTVDVWSSAAVHGDRSTMAPDSRKLAAVGHRHVIGAAVSPRQLGYCQPVLLADRNGAVSMWETFGVRLSDPLPPDPAHRQVIGIAVLPQRDDGIAVVTASRADRNLRVWEPLRGSATLVPLSIQPRCLLSAGDALVIGHDDGILALALAISPGEGS